MQAIYNYVLSMEISTILCALFVLVYGLPFAIGNWFRWFSSLFNGKGLRQSDKGRLLDVLWLLCVLWMIVVIFK